MTTIDQAAARYWKFSQYLATLTKPEDRTAFLAFTVIPTIESSKSQKEKELLTRLLNREPAAATA